MTTDQKIPHQSPPDPPRAGETQLPIWRTLSRGVRSGTLEELPRAGAAACHAWSLSAQLPQPPPKKLIAALHEKPINPPRARSRKHGTQPRRRAFCGDGLCFNATANNADVSQKQVTANIL